jgi:hypothetical protein
MRVTARTGKASASTTGKQTGKAQRRARPAAEQQPAGKAGAIAAPSAKTDNLNLPQDFIDAGWIPIQVLPTRPEGSAAARADHSKPELPAGGQAGAKVGNMPARPAMPATAPTAAAAAAKAGQQEGAKTGAVNEGAEAKKGNANKGAKGAAAAAAAGKPEAGASKQEAARGAHKNPFNGGIAL